MFLFFIFPYMDYQKKKKIKTKFELNLKWDIFLFPKKKQ